MDFKDFNFASPALLWGLLLLPLVWLSFAFFYRKSSYVQKLEKFIDNHLLKYLLVTQATKSFSLWRALFVWSLIWSSLILSLAGPRWSYREFETYSSDQNLVILLDLSQSMDAEDVKPSRLIRAKQKIEDILNQAKGLHIGLIAFAADAHMIAPLTQDLETIRHLLPSLDTDLVFVQGSKLKPALEMAEAMFALSVGENRAILAISDGGFEDASAMTEAKAMAGRGILLYGMGVGTADGAPIRDKQGNLIKKEGSPLISKLDEEKLRELGQLGGGRYLKANSTDGSETLLLQDLKSRAQAFQNMKKTTRLWDERFYLLIIPALPFVLLWLRRGCIIPLVLAMISSPFSLQAAGIGGYFKNSEQAGSEALELQDYGSAAEYFKDPYRKGVAEYRAGRFAEAEALFRASNREEVACDAAYNAGNALVQQEKLKEAVEQYEEVLKRWPDCQKARENLELVKKMLQEQEQQKQQSDESQKNDTNDDKEQNSQDENSSQKNEPGDDKGQQQPKEPKQEESSDNENNETPQEQEPKPSSANDTKEGQQKPEQKEKNNSGQEEQKDRGVEPKHENENSEQHPPFSPPNEGSDPAPAMKEPLEEKSMKDQDADQWLKRIQQDPKEFLKNKFYLESKRKGTKEQTDPW